MRSVPNPGYCGHIEETFLAPQASLTPAPASEGIPRTPRLFSL